MAPPARTPGNHPVARALRYLVRVPLLLLHVVAGLLLALVVMAPPWGALQVAGERLEHRAIRYWSALLMQVFGFRLRRSGTPNPGATLFVANHVSWADIEIMHSQRMMGFVAKQEIAGWPLVGWMATRGETIYHRRGDTESMGGVLHEMLARLRAGRSVGVFPEGRTRGGDAVGPFHARIFLPAVEAGVPVQPVALRYGEGGSMQTTVAFGPNENFAQNLWRLLGEPARRADVVFLPVIAAGDADGRRRIAELARERIVAALAHR